MKTKTVGLVAAAFALSLSFAPAAFAEGTCDCEEPPAEKERADNGWGNGGDSTNAGSNSGKTEASKSINRYGSGPGPEKFTTR